MQYCLIQLISHNLPNPLTYCTSDSVFIGDLVLVKLKNKNAYGIVIGFTLSIDFFAIKPIEVIIQTTIFYKKFIQILSEYYLLSELILYKKIVYQLSYIKKNTDFIITKDVESIEEYSLNLKQKEIINSIKNKELDSEKKPFLIHGVTGSGKTFIYIELIKYYLSLGKSIICLFPNTSLAITVAAVFKKYFANEIIHEYHSATKKEDREKIWQCIQEKKIIVVCGVYLPIFLPIFNIGIYIIDEEHDVGYQENRFPYINVKEAALIRAKIENAIIVLSSATPSMVTMYHAQEGKYEYAFLSERYHDVNLPKIENVFIEDKEKLISEKLKEQIEMTIQEGQQVLLFFNKKGRFSYAMCDTCHYKFICKNCSVLLTIYDYNLAKCHRCGFKEMIPEYCTKCKVAKTKIKKIGKGIQQIETQIKEIFPFFKVKQIDGDLLKTKSEYDSLIKDMNERKYDILLGTQIISKGYNFNSVFLVGVINADMFLTIPHFMNTEELVQQMIQVGGRAGREKEGSRVLIQTFLDTDLAYYFDEKNYLAYVAYELEFRNMLFLPPFSKMALLLIKSFDEEIIFNTINNIYADIKSTFDAILQENELEVSSPHKPLYAKIKKNYYYQIVIKSKNYKNNTMIVSYILKKYKSSHYFLRYIPHPILNFYE